MFMSEKKTEESKVEKKTEESKVEKEEKVKKHTHKETAEVVTLRGDPPQGALVPSNASKHSSTKSTEANGTHHVVSEEKKVEQTDKPVQEEKEPEKKAKKTAPKAKKKPKKSSAIVARGKRKKSIARARVKVGKGQFRVNGSAINSVQNKYIRELMLEPVKLAGEKALQVDISASSYGGGVMGQAQAVRTAIARGLVEYFEDDALKQVYLERDRSLLIEDPRRVEPKKYRGPKSRARYQKSYR